MKDLKKALASERLWFDGGYGTLLQEMGLPPGTPPARMSLLDPDAVISLHRAYLEAGSRILTANTFGIDRLRCPDYDRIIEGALRCARAAVGDREDLFIALDLGPTGRMLQPLGDLPFEEAVSLYADNIRAAEGLGADLILIETMSDCLETKAAVLAAKENSALPVFVTNAYDRSGKLMTGGDPLSMIALLEGLGVDAIGMNCSFGPDGMEELIGDFLACSSLPLIVNPNAGLPLLREGRTVYGIGPEEFSDSMARLAARGVGLLGGCCGTTPAHIAAAVKKTAAIPYTPPVRKDITLVSSYTHAVRLGGSPVMIGERINPTGKPRLKEALRSGDLRLLLTEGVRQREAGAEILDVNVGLPELDEAETMAQAVLLLQSVTDTPLQLDSSSPAVLERAMRLYNGKPMINSVSGDRRSLAAVLPAVRKYGGVVVGLTMDEEGIPPTAEGRLAIAERILTEAERFGIDRRDIVIDPLCLALSSLPDSAQVTLKTLTLLRERGIRTVLGISNISFGLPAREKLNAAFFAAALTCGLSCAILNPFSEAMTDVFFAFRVLRGEDEGCRGYIAYTDRAGQERLPSAEEITLEGAILHGLKEQAAALTDRHLSEEEPLSVIDRRIIPALEEVGRRFEEKRCYLPQLLMSADAAAAAFERVKARLPKRTGEAGRGMILATVKGDLHDIGKNIVRVLLESYGFTVYDLGRDVSPDRICAAAQQTGCRLIGLSALMTTTVPAMEETIAVLHERCPGCRVAVGGAVLNAECAERIGADFYCPDAMDTVRVAQRFYAGAEEA